MRGITSLFTTTSSSSTSSSILLLLLLFTTFQGRGLATSTPPTVSPISDFVARPLNVTVLEGHPAVLRCKLKDTVHNCQWFHFELGLDVFDPASKRSLVKQFRPTSNNDCSIKFSSTRKIQTGQWICKGLQIHAQKYVISEPAILQVISPKGRDNSNVDPDGESNGKKEGTQEDEDLSFMISEEGHIINTKLGDAAVIGCLANKELQECAWIRPDGTKMRFPSGADENYSLDGDYSEGNCSLLIHRVSERDEGNWRCVVSLTNATGHNLGPLIHLHVLEFGIHAQGAQGFSGEKKKDSSLIIILVVTSVVLLVVIIALVAYMYKNVWRRNLPHHKQLDSNAAENLDYSNYGSSTKWIPGRRDSKDEKQLIYESTEMQNSPEYTRYLDMSGQSKPEEYVVFPRGSSPPSSLGSKTTLSMARVSHNASGAPDSDDSPRASTGASVHSASTVGNPIYNPHIQGRGLPERQESVCSEGHLYEEIDETKMRRKENIDEDQEGYMIPKSCSLDESIVMKEGEGNKTPPTPDFPSTYKLGKAPPYSKVGENGLVLDSDAAPSVEEVPANSEEGGDAPEDEESQDVPSGPPLPVRVDSLDNALAEYDVPPRSSQEVLPVFV